MNISEMESINIDPVNEGHYVDQIMEKVIYQPSENQLDTDHNRIIRMIIK